MDNIRVISGGALTTIQDIGRYGYQRFGIPVTGVMDEYSYKIANYLVGNDENEAVLEMTYIGASLEFLEDMVIAITGANLRPQINRQNIGMWQSLKVKKGDILSFLGAKEGIRTYLAFGGKIDVPAVNGSKSTFLKSKLGGYKGRAIQKGDMIKIDISSNAKENKKLDEKYIPKVNKEQRIRVVLGPQDDYFTDEGISTFFSKDGYTITQESDRMGIRLDGDKINHKEKADIISDGAVIGSIQVPANGMPIILMADRQTTGGYTKIATVIKEDICKIAQMGTNFKVYFEKLDILQAQEEYRNFCKKLEDIRVQISNSTVQKEDISKSKTKDEGIFESQEKGKIKKEAPISYKTYDRTNKSAFTSNINGKEYEIEIRKIN